MLIFGFVLFSSEINAQQPDYKNKALPEEKRVKDLLSRMTLKEKVAQLLTIRPNKILKDNKALEDPKKMDAFLKNGLGMVNPYFQLTNAEVYDFHTKVQDYLMNKTRLGISTIFIDEGHHGLMTKGG